MRPGRTAAHETRRAPRPGLRVSWLWCLAAAFSPGLAAAWLASARETEASERFERELAEFLRSL